VTVAAIATGCGATDGGAEGSAGADPGPRPQLPRAAAAAASPLPEVTVWDVGNAEWTQFADLRPGTTPLLLWFWAPHCPACAAEAPDVVDFAAAHRGRIDVVGIGTQDDPQMAREFVERHQVPFTMLCDQGFDSWTPFGVRAQPAFVLLDAEGRSLGGWLGDLPEAEVVELAA